MRLLTLILSLAFFAAPVFAQQARPDPQQPEGGEGVTPPSWKVRFDHADAQPVVGADPETADVFFVNMTPGWHITAKPSGIYYHPGSTANGIYRAETKIHLFDPEGRNEAFGLFFGGRNLDRNDVSYDYFVIRNNGEFLIKRRNGGETSTIKEWTRSPAIQTFGPNSGTSVANTLAVEAGVYDVAFFINGQEVARLPKNDLRTEGVVGLRINHNLNLHVEDLSVNPLGR